MNRLLFAFLLAAASLPVLATQGYYRSPDLHQDKLVFTAEGDLWLASISDGKSHRLTTHPAEEIQASFSPDGNRLAYTANYEGATEVYVIPVNGGMAKRVTFENASVRAQGWTADGKIVYSTNSQVGPSSYWTLKLVDPETLQTTNIPVADAIQGEISGDNKNLFFIQYGLQLSSDNSKVYRGGATGELWRFTLGSNKEAVQLTGEHKGSVRQPMLANGRVYFISDESGADNIWSMAADGTGLTQITRFNDWPVRSARLDGNRIIMQQGADIRLLNLTDNQIQNLKISLTSDLPNMREHWLNKPLKYLTSSRLAGDFEKIVLTARGKVAIAGTDKSRLVEVYTNPESRTRNALLSHDGEWVYGLNDASGEIEIWQFAADGSTEARQLTKDGKVFRWNLYLSPDGKWLAHDDKDGNLWLLNTKSGKNKKLFDDEYGLSPIQDISWSADSQLMAITRSRTEDLRSRVQLYAINNGKQQILTSDKYNSYSPAFSRDGKWLYFLSERNFKATPGSPWGDRNLGTLLDRRSLIFAYALKADAEFPFSPPTELNEPKKSEETSEKEKKSEDKSSAKRNKKSDKTPLVDWRGIEARLWQVPVAAGNYGRLEVSEEFLYAIDQINEPDSKPQVKSIEIKPFTKIETFAEKVADYDLSDDGKKIFIRQQGADNGNMFIVKASAKFPKETKDSKVIVKDWQLAYNPQQEWRQLFHDAWLMHRDSLFDKKMRGLDWQAVKSKYEPLLDRVTDRYELDDIFKQMMGELNALHSQVRGGDKPKDPDAPKTATLGAELRQTKNGVKIQTIFTGDPELPDTASPLAKPGVDARVGDLITAVNGLATPDLASINRLLRNQAGKQVLLELERNSKQLHTVVVPAPGNQAYRLRYQQWVTDNRTKVANANETFGYLHLYAMGGNDVASFAREFYANYNQQGLIIDVRRNRGGNIDSWILEKLLRRAWMFWQPTQGKPFVNMQQTFRGHLVVLADEFTYSDGETFTAGIKALELGPVIGKRTAGAGVWLRGMNRLSDNGMARVAEFPYFDMQGAWLVEGYGVAPDIEVSNLPHATYQGEDAQLDAAIAYLADKLKKEPVPELKAEPIPDANIPAKDINR